MRAFASLILVVAFSFFAVATAMLVYHFQRFRLQREHHRMLIWVFLVGSAVLLLLELFFFGAVDWEVLSEYLPAVRIEPTL